MPETQYIKKVTLPDGSSYMIKDAGAPRTEDLDDYLPLTGGTLTGDLTVETDVEVNTLTIDSITSESNTPDNVLISDANGAVKKRALSSLKGDIDAFSVSMDSSTGILSFS